MTDHQAPSRRGLRPKIGTGLAALTAAGALLLASTATAGPTSPVGKATVSGQVQGNLKAPRLGTGPHGVPFEGCQISPEGSTQVLVNFFTSKLRLNGHARTAKAIELSVEVAKNGNSESLAPIDNNVDAGVALTLVVSGRTYIWSSISGTVKSSAHGRSGSFNAQLLPDGSPQLGSQEPKTGATKPAHITGSWTNCHPG